MIFVAAAPNRVGAFGGSGECFPRSPLHCHWSWLASTTVVVQRVSRVRRPFDAGDGAQIFVDGIEIMIGHVRKCWPWHDLEKTAVNWSGNAIWRCRFRL